jgi:2-isopropylmalate synthase
MNTQNIKIFDTTLRDGEQSPGFSMNTDEKISMAKQLAKLKVDIIEAGFPVASEGDFEAVQRIATEVKGPIIAGLSRANLKDIERCYEAIKVADKHRIHTFIATSDIHLKHKLRKSRTEVLKIVEDSVKFAKSLTKDVEFSAEDATRSDWDYLVEVVELVIASGATTVNIPDTVGYTVPGEYFKLISYLKSKVSNIDQAVISVHCHNDLGLAVANSLAAIQAGARQVECTINGIGERAGNASIEEIVMALKVRQEEFSCDTNIDAKQLYASSRKLSMITGIPVQPNKAIVGENAFAHESGIHQDGMLKNHLTYEIMTPESVGWSKTNLVLGKHSGRHAFSDRLISLGYDLSPDDLTKAFISFKAVADRKKEIYDDDLVAIVEEQSNNYQERFKLKDLVVHSESDQISRAKIAIEVDGELHTAEAEGAGAVEVIFRIVREALNSNSELLKFKVSSVTGGVDALAEVTVVIKENGHEVRGSGMHMNVLTASALSYINALSRLALLKDRNVDRVIL